MRPETLRKLEAQVEAWLRERDLAYRRRRRLPRGTWYERRFSPKLAFHLHLAHHAGWDRFTWQAGWSRHEGLPNVERLSRVKSECRRLGRGDALFSCSTFWGADDEWWSLGESEPPRELVEAFGPEAATVWAEEEMVIVTHAALGKLEKHVLPFFERFIPAPEPASRAATRRRRPRS